MSLFVRYQDHVTLVENDKSTLLREFAVKYLKDKGLIFNENWEGADQLSEVSLIDPQDLLRSKPLREQNQTLDQAGVFDGTLLQIHLLNAIEVELDYQDYHNDSRKENVILPTFLPVQMLIDELIGNRSNMVHDSYYLHVIDPDLPSGLRRLLSEQTLQEQGISGNETFYLSRIGFTDDMISKSIKADIHLVDTDGRSTRSFFPIDAQTNMLSEFMAARNMKQIEQEDEFLIELPPMLPIPPSDSKPIVIPQIDLDVFSGPDVTDYSWLGLLSAGERTVATGMSADHHWWQIIYPHQSSARGWIEALYTQAENVEDLPVIPKPKIVSPNLTLWEAGVRQNDVVPIIQANKRNYLIENLAKRFSEAWEIRKIIAENTTELSLYFSTRSQPKKEIYLRLLSDAICFQIPVLTSKLPSFKESWRHDFYEYLQDLEDTMVPLSFVIDEEYTLFLQFNASIGTYRQLVDNSLDPPTVLSSSVVKCKSLIENWLRERSLIVGEKEK